jgi:hypothetical protein
MMVYLELWLRPLYPIQAICELVSAGNSAGISSQRDSAVNEISNSMEPDGSNGAAQPHCTLLPTLTDKRRL